MLKKLLFLTAVVGAMTATQFSHANSPSNTTTANQLKFGSFGSAERAERVVSQAYQSHQPSGWVCDGMYVPHNLIQKIEIGNKTGIYLKGRSKPTLKHFLGCSQLVDIYS